MSQTTWCVTTNRRGIALPAVVLAIGVLAILAVAALRTAVDERMASSSVRTGAAAVYAAEAGLNETLARWNDTTTTLDSLVQGLQPGDSLAQPWRTLVNGDRYRAVVYRRFEDGNQPLYQLIAEGRHGDGATRAVSYWVTPGSGGTLGGCCKSTATVRGGVLMDDNSTLTGIEGNPPGWDPTCATEDKPGIIVEDVNDLVLSGGGVDGVPPIVEDTSMSDETFETYGALTWEEIKNMADHTIGIVGPETYPNTAPHGDPSDPLGPIGSNGLPSDASDNWIGPRHNADGTCNVDHPLNWGSNDPNDPCYGHFPIVLVRGQVEIRGDSAYGQGVFLLGPNGVSGAEFEFEVCSSRENDVTCPGMVVVGIIIGRGCVDIEDRTRFFGSVFVDGDYFQATCENPPLYVEGNASVQYSGCGVQRALARSGLGAAASRTMVRLERRAFTELLR